MTEATPSLADHYDGNGVTAAAGTQRQNENQEAASAPTAALLRPTNLQPYTDAEPVSDNYQVVERINNCQWAFLINSPTP